MDKYILYERKVYGSEIHYQTQWRLVIINQKETIIKKHIKVEFRKIYNTKAKRIYKVVNIETERMQIVDSKDFEIEV